MNPSSEVWFIHLSVITAVQLQQMGWQGASWHHPAQTHACKCAHTCNIYHLPHTHAQTNSQMHVLTNQQLYPLVHTHAHTHILLVKFWEETEGKGEGGIKVCRERSSKVFLSIYLIWAFSTCFIHSALSAGIWRPRCKHWVYKCFVLFICLPSKPEEATGGEQKWGKRKSECFRRADEEETSKY